VLPKPGDKYTFYGNDLDIACFSLQFEGGAYKTNFTSDRPGTVVLTGFWTNTDPGSTDTAFIPGFFEQFGDKATN